MTFIHAMRTILDKKYRKKAFTRLDFVDLAKEYGKSDRQIIDVLRRLHGFGLLEIVGERPRAQGGGALKVYRVVKGADFTVKTTDWRHEAKKKEAYLNTCANRLQRVVDGWMGGWADGCE